MEKLFIYTCFCYQALQYMLLLATAQWSSAAEDETTSGLAGSPAAYH